MRDSEIEPRNDNGRSETLTRRKMLTGAASALPAVALASLPALAAASKTDPIFAAIEAHRAAHAVFVSAVEEEDRLDEELPADRRRSRSWGGELTIVETDAPEWIAHQQAYRATSDAEEEAAVALICIVPTTLAGVQAVLRYSAEHIEHGHSWPGDGSIEDDDGQSRFGRDWSFFLHRMLVEAVAGMAA